MNYIVLDLEWNQADGVRETEREELPFEIIEIGAVKLNSDREMIDQFNELIKPQVYHVMHYVTRKLIHLQMSQLEKGSPFPEVCEKFLNWCGEDPIFCTWGPTDLTQLQKNMDYYHLKPLTDKPLAFLDVQKLFSIAYQDKKTRSSLSDAIRLMKIPEDIPFHRAFSDAYYTAKILEKIEDDTVLSYCSFDTYRTPKRREDEVRIRFETYAKLISMEYPDKSHALADKEIASCKCYICGRKCRKKIKWFTPNGKHYYSVSFCDKHGLMKGKIRVRKAEDGNVYVVKTQRLITQEEMDAIKQRQVKAESAKKEQQKKMIPSRNNKNQKVRSSKPESFLRAVLRR
ncbi:MAG: exonuclease domain-containing protein [Lachnospiraceae bacterium]|nr:exonuclease domain-containing protein [Lachnospiraceae bacterium]